MVRVNAETGLVAGAGETNVILEALKPDPAPRTAGPVIDGGYGSAASTNTNGSGIY